MKRMFICVALAMAPATAAAGETAQDIASRALENNTLTASNARAELQLEVSKAGKVRRRRRISTKVKRAGKELRSFVEFQSPAEVAGTKFLSVEADGGEPNQYIYLPAFKKVKRVVGSQRSRSFMGTDFSYSDLDGRDVDAANWKRLDDQEYGGQACFVIEGTPKEKAEYGRSVFWVHKKHLVPMRIDFFDLAGKAVKKRFTVKRLERKSDRWVATDSIMATLAKDTNTRLKVVRIDFDTEIPDSELSRVALEP